MARQDCFFMGLDSRLCQFDAQRLTDHWGLAQLTAATATRGDARPAATAKHSIPRSQKPWVLPPAPAEGQEQTSVPQVQ